MKRTISLVLSLIMIIGMFSGLNLTAYAERTNNDSNDRSFPYSNSDVYVADSIIKGIIDKEGVAHGSSEISMALLHNYTYHNLSEALIDDGALVFDSVFWQNLKSTLSGDFVNIANWQEEMYVLLIIDYLNYYSQSYEFESNFEKNTVKFTEDIYKAVIKYANNEYLDNVDDFIKNQSLSDAVALSDKWGVVNKLNKYNSVLGDIETVSNTAVDYYKNLSKALSVQKADESRIEFLKQMKKAGSNNYYFVTAVNNVISMYESSYSSLVFAESSKTMLKHGMSVLFSEAKKACPEAAAIIDGLKIYTKGLNWLFNSDDISKNNLKLIIVYTIGSYASSAVRSLRDTYSSNPTDENANAFINGYIGYLKYQEYASNNTIGFVSSALFDGIVNQIKNIFSNENKATYNEFKEYFNNDISFCEKLEELIKKHYDLYFAIVGYNSTVLTDNNSNDNLTEIDSSDIYSNEVTYNFLISGQSVITRDLILTDNLTICGDLYLNGGTLDLNGYTLTVYGNLIQSGGEMYIDGGMLEVEGNYRIQTYQKTNASGEEIFTVSSGSIDMIYENDIVRIGGDFYTQSKINPFLAAGTMEIGGDFKQISTNASDSNFLCGDSHKVILSGNGNQNISFSSSNSQFNVLEVKNTDKRELKWHDYFSANQITANNYTIVNSLYLQSSSANIIKIIDDNIDIYADDLTVSGLGGSYNRINIHGNVTMKGDINLNSSTLTITGNLYQPSGEMYINNGTLNIGGNYRIQTYQKTNASGEEIFTVSSGSIDMIYENDIVRIGGDFYTQSEINPFLAAGTMEIGGDFKQISTNASDSNFLCGDSHKVILSGNGNQNISFSSSNSQFNVLEVKNTDKRELKWHDYFSANQITANNYIIVNSLYLQSSSTNTIKITDDNIDIYADDLTVSGLVGNYNKINIHGNLTMKGEINLNSSTLTITGNLIQSGGTMYINNGTLNIGENYRIQTYQKTNSSGEEIFTASSGDLEMEYENDVVRISGDFYTQSKINPFLAAGTMEIGGDFKQISTNASDYNFYCSGSHKVILNGSNVQTIHFDSTDSKFNILKLTKDKKTGYIFEPDNCWNELILLSKKDYTDANSGITVTTYTEAELAVEKITDSESINKINEMLVDETLKSVIDISLNKDGAKIQPDGTVTVKIPTSNKNAKVYRVESNGTLTNMNASFDSGYAVFSADNLGQFALAVENNNDVALGDVNGDGDITIDDVTLIQKYIANMSEFDSEQLKAADVTGDGDITIDDVTKIQKFIAGLVSSLSNA